MPIPDIKSYLAPLSDELRREWPKNRMVHVVFHGHSVPAGYFRTPVVDTFHAYPHLVHVGIKAAYPHAVVNATVTAIGGENSLSGAKRFERDVLSLRPDVVVIDYALNDRRKPLEQVETAWRSMIQTSKKHRIPVILLTPTGDETADMNDPADPLRQRADRSDLVQRAFERAAAESGAPAPMLAEAACRALARHSWPGNLRELQHVARFALAVSDAAITVRAVSGSRVSPTMITSGSARNSARSEVAKLQPILGLTWI